MAKTTKKRNPNDATLRNVRAVRREIGSLKARLALLAERIGILEGKKKR